MVNNLDFIVTARKWRPLKFKDVIGQSHITTTLINSIKAGRIAHSYLFSGPRGVGKTTTARIFARAVNCENPQDFEPCNECNSCIQIIENRSLDVIEIDGASNNSVDDVRKLRENAKFTPVTSKYKLYIIDEVHMLSTSAFNALLKTLEEPPPHLLFIFATTEPHKVPATILSRCQRFDFRRIEVDKIVEQLKSIASYDSVDIDDKSLYAIAVKADGSMRDAQSLYDQIIALCGRKIDFETLASALHLIDTSFYFRISNAIKERNLQDVFAISNELFYKGYDVNECLSGLLEHFRNLLSLKVSGRNYLINISNDFIEKYENEARYFSEVDLVRIMSIISSAQQQMRFVSQPRLKFELTLLQLASIDSSVEITKILDIIKNVESINIDDKNSNYNISKGVLEPKLSYTAKIEENKNKKIGYDDKFYNPILDNEQSTKFQKIYENLEDGWKDFVSEYGNTTNNLFVLKDINNIHFLKNEIIIRTSTDFVYDTLIKNKNHLADLLEKFYSKRVELKIIKEKEQELISESSTTDHNDNLYPEEKLDYKNDNDISEIEKSIIQNFGAKPTKRKT